MLVIEREEETGQLVLRPAFLRYIKNNVVRRTLMIIYSPFILLITIILNGFYFNFLWLLKSIKNILDIRLSKNKYWDNPAPKKVKDNETNEHK